MTADLCRRDDILIGFGGAGRILPPRAHAHDEAWLASHCWVCERPRGVILTEQGAWHDRPGGDSMTVQNIPAVIPLTDAGGNQIPDGNAIIRCDRDGAYTAKITMPRGHTGRVVLNVPVMDEIHLAPGDPDPAA